MNVLQTNLKNTWHFAKCICTFCITLIYVLAIHCFLSLKLMLYNVLLVIIISTQSICPHTLWTRHTFMSICCLTSFHTLRWRLVHIVISADLRLIWIRPLPIMIQAALAVTMARRRAFPSVFEANTLLRGTSTFAFALKNALSPNNGLINCCCSRRNNFHCFPSFERIFQVHESPHSANGASH